MSGGRTTEAKVLSNPKGSFIADELVVRLPYHRLVLARLDDWSASPGSKDTRDKNATIGLCRIPLDAAAARRHLEDRHADWVDDARAEAAAGGYETHDLEIVLRCLRKSFAAEYGGWTPTLGKNRVMRRPEGSYVIDGGGKKGPTAVPDYVIDGGGTGRPDPAQSGSPHSVAYRRRLPGAGTRVGVVDTRVWPHPWFSGALVAYPEDQISRLEAADESAAGDLPDHATFVAGLVLRQAPGALVELRRALKDDATSDTWSVATTLAELADSSVDVVNLSLGCLTDDAKPPLVLSAALDALGPRMMVVAAAGNHAEGPGDQFVEPSYPAALDNVIAVGAWDRKRPAPFTPTAPWVDAMAPGVDLVSTCDPNRDGTVEFGTWSGTSFAAAVVTGAIAARTKECGGARRAWKEIRKTSERDSQGRPVVGLSVVDDWPPDGRGTASGHT